MNIPGQNHGIGFGVFDFLEESFARCVVSGPLIHTALLFLARIPINASYHDLLASTCQRVALLGQLRIEPTFLPVTQHSSFGMEHGSLKWFLAIPVGLVRTILSRIQHRDIRKLSKKQCCDTTACRDRLESLTNEAAYARSRLDKRQLVES